MVSRVPHKISRGLNNHAVIDAVLLEAPLLDGRKEERPPVTGEGRVPSTESPHLAVTGSCGPGRSLCLRASLSSSAR